MQTIKYLRYAGKAIIGGGLAFAGALGVALTDGHVSGTEWTVIATATLAALGGVFGFTNGEKPGA